MNQSECGGGLCGVHPQALGQIDSLRSADHAHREREVIAHLSDLNSALGLGLTVRYSGRERETRRLARPDSATMNDILTHGIKNLRKKEVNGGKLGIMEERGGKHLNWGSNWG